MLNKRGQDKLYRRPDEPGGVYYMDFFRSGKRIRRSLKTNLLKEAKARRDAVLAGEAKQEWGAAGDDITPAQFWKRYLDHAKTHLQPRTIERRDLTWRQFVECCKPKRLGSVTHDDVERFKTHSADVLKHSNATINDDVKRLGAFYNLAISEGWYGAGNPTTLTKRLPTESKPVRFLGPEQIDLVLEVAERVSPAIHLFIALAVFAGLRKREAVFARWDWIDWEGQSITVQGDDDRFMTKNKRHRTISLHERLCTILEPYREPEGYIIQESDRPSKGKSRYRYEPRRAFESVVRAAEVPWCTPHILRHTFASRLVQEGVSLFKVATWLGHSHTRVTEIYSHIERFDSEINKL